MFPGAPRPVQREGLPSPCPSRRPSENERGFCTEQTAGPLAGTPWRAGGADLARLGLKKKGRCFPRVTLVIAPRRSSGFRLSLDWESPPSAPTAGGSGLL